MANSDLDKQGKDDAHRSVVSDALASNLDDLPAVITTAEAARALRVGVREIRQLIDAGHLPAARLGPRRVIRIDRGVGRVGLAEKSIKNIRTTLHTILVFAVKWDYLDRMPELPDVVVPEASFDWYRPHEAAALVAAARDAWERAVLLFPLHTGARMGEQRAIRWADIDFDLRRVYIRQSAPKWLDEVKAPKSNRQRWVDLSPELAISLRSIRHGGPLVFCNDDGTKLAPGQFHEVLWAAQKRAGLRRIKWHEPRHSYASILASGGMPLLMIRGLLGHQSSRMTERYAHLAAGQSEAFVHLLSAASPALGPATSDASSSGPRVGPRPSHPRSTRVRSVAVGSRTTSGRAAPEPWLDTVRDRADA
jgi:excisionase family DNA binding protein